MSSSCGGEPDFAAAGALRYTALPDEIIADGATPRIAEGLPQLTGAAIAPAHRRRSIQTALLPARLTDAAAAGCGIAAATTQPASTVSPSRTHSAAASIFCTHAILARQP